jgi:hypothetical protein
VAHIGEGETLALHPGGVRAQAIAEAQAAGLLDVDLGDGWAPFIFSESDGPEGKVLPNLYRKTFVDLANDRVDPDELFLAGGATRAIDLSPEAEEKRRQEEEDRRLGKRKPEPPPAPPRKRSEPVHNFLEPFGILPSLSVLLARVEEDAQRDCYQTLDLETLRTFEGNVTYQSQRQARRELEEARADAAWLAQRLAELGDAGVPDAAGAGGDGGLGAGDAGALERLAADPKAAARIERFHRGQRRLAAIKALQARLGCEGLLTARSRFVEGMFDLPTHQALAAWERKNDIFGWGFLAPGETLTALARPPLELHLETFRRILTEHIADAAAILEDGSVSTGKKPATYKDAEGAVHPVPDVVAQHLEALLAALKIDSGETMVRFLRQMQALGGLARLHVAFAPPPLPPYYSGNPERVPGPPATGSGERSSPAPTRLAKEMDLEVDIDRGDVWYEFPFDAKGKAIEQRRVHYPHLIVYVRWNEQRIPLARWRTTIGSWRSEMHPDGKVYYKYKQSDVGPRVWKHIVAAPVWVPPDGTPAKDLLTRKEFDRHVGPVPVVNTEVMGPGFQSAYGLVMAIHHKVTAGGGLFDNQIRTHGSVDYTSIARRFSHGCHRLVNTRAVRLFGFVLRHRPYVRLGDSPLHIKKFFAVEEQRYGYELDTRGYYYELKPPLKVEVLEGKIMGQLQKPITEYVRKPGVDYGDEEENPLEVAPVVGP